MALFAVAIFLLFLIQCLALFGVVADRGQSLLTLFGQAALGLTSAGIVFLYVCLGIGLGRALRALQDRSELQVIHGSALIPALMNAVLVYAVGGALGVLALTHLVDPLSVRTTNNWAASIAADLVSRSMIPHRFTELTDGVNLVIGSRDSEGRIADFFADDSRSATSRRTYFAKSAVITRDEEGYVLRMLDGAIQQFSADKRMSQISFARYDLALDQLTSAAEASSGLAATTSIQIVQEALAAGSWSPVQIETLTRRSAEGLRVIAMCLFVAALALFPSGSRRRFSVPIELAVLAAAFIERGISSYAPLPKPFEIVAGPSALTLLALLILAIRFRVFIPLPLRRAA